MTEDFLQFIWKYGLFERDGMVADSGEEVHVINLGEHNSDAGPDFLNTRIKIGNTTWAGNVEIHVRSADWNLHRHESDRAYDNVILHVVHNYDQPVVRHSGGVVPTVELKYNTKLYENYCLLLSHKSNLPCKDKISRVDPLIIDVWLNSLVIERLQEKTRQIVALLDQFRNNWEEAFYVSLARSFGFSLNAIPFEMTAKSIPLSYLLRHRNNRNQTEALLMGQAGFLEEAVLFNGYYSDLRTEYTHLKKKYNLKPLEKHLWKFLRLRPVNFPTIRLSQFAVLLQQSEGLFSRVMSCKDIREVMSLFDVHASEFWNEHYTFETISAPIVKNLGTEAVQIIIINTVIPFLFIYGKMTGNDDLRDRALTWLSHLPAEKNRITNRWQEFGISATSALYSQGILQLANTYCMRKRCLACSIGAHVITAAAL